jgi:endonuclease YncB( thermonuclease family)
MKIRWIAAVVALVLADHAVADPIAPGAVRVIDDDTIQSPGRHVRRVGFDTPESGFNVQCESERAVAARATFRLRQLVVGGALDLSLVSPVPGDARDAIDAAVSTIGSRGELYRTFLYRFDGFVRTVPPQKFELLVL